MINEVIYWAERIGAIVAVIGVFVEITPIKVSPLAYIGKKMNSHLNERLDDLEKKVDNSIMERRNNDARNKRGEILDFANSCRNGRPHTLEEWNNIIDDLAEYERLCHDNFIENNKMPTQAKYLRDLYYKLSLEGKFEKAKQNGELVKYD